MSGIETIRPDWKVSSRVHAAFTLRFGGASSAPFESLNLGAHVGDAPEAVAENRDRVRRQLGLPVEPGWLQQIHGTHVVNLDEVAPPGTADAAICRRDDRVCVIQVADCIPVLFAAQDGSVVAAAHAGWRGLVGGVLEATVGEMAVEPATVAAWLGPGISQNHFEVGAEVREAFVAADSRAVAAFAVNSRGRWQCDLYSLARLRLSSLGITDISGAEACTYENAGRFFSYRRDGQCGRMAAFIWLGQGRAA